MTAFQTTSMLDIIAANRNQTVKQVRDQYMELWFDDIDASMISESLVYRTFKRERLSHRILETRNMLQNPQQQMEFLDGIRHVDPARIIDIDGMAQSRKDFIARYGWVRKVKNVFGCKSRSIIEALQCTLHINSMVLSLGKSLKVQ